MGSFHVQRYAAGIAPRPARAAAQVSDLTTTTLPPEVLDIAGGDPLRVEVRGGEYVVHNNRNWRKLQRRRG